MFIVQYLMQFSGPPRNISNPGNVQDRFAQANRGSTNTTIVAFHVLLLPSKHYYSRVPYLLHGRRSGHS